MKTLVCNRNFRLIAGAVFACMVFAPAACHDSPTAVTPPEPGVLSVRLVTPHDDDRALRLTISGGAVSKVESAKGELTLLDRVSNTGATVLLFGKLSSGIVVRMQVPDLNKAAGYHAAVIEAADAAHQLRDVTTGYSATLEQ